MKIHLIFLAVWAAAASVSAVEIRPGGFYEATFSARVVAGANLEDLPEYAELIPIQTSRRQVAVAFPYVQWTFRTAKGGKMIPRPHEGASPMTLFSKEWKTFCYRFWAPEDATWVEFKPSEAKGAKAEICDFAVTELKRTGELLPHPEFSDTMAPLGWQLVGPAAYLTDGNGRAFVACHGGRAVSDLFPVEPMSNLKITLTGSSPRHEAKNDHVSARLAFCANFADGAKGSQYTKKAAMTSGKHKTVTQEFKVPEGMHWVRVAVFNGEVEKVSVERTGL